MGDTLVQYAACLTPIFSSFFLFLREEREREGERPGWHNSIPITLVGRVLQSFFLWQVCGLSFFLFLVSLGWERAGRGWSWDTANLLV